MKYYIASSINNRKQVQQLRDLLNAAGWRHTHDWTVAEGETEENVSNARRREIADNDIVGVRLAQVVIVLLPGGRGTHVELGVAIGDNKWIHIWAPDANMYDESPFYWSIDVMREHCPSIDDLASMLISTYGDPE